MNPFAQLTTFGMHFPRLGTQALAINYEVYLR